MADQTTPDTIRVYGASDDLIETHAEGETAAWVKDAYLAAAAGDVRSPKCAACGRRIGYVNVYGDIFGWGCADGNECTVPGPRKAYRDALAVADTALGRWPYDGDPEAQAHRRNLQRLAAELGEDRPASARPSDRPAGNVSASKYARTRPRPATLREQTQAWLREYQQLARAGRGRTTLRDVMAAAYRNGLGLHLDEDVWQRDDQDEEWKHREWSITNAHHREVGRLAIDTGDSFRRVELSDRRGRFAPVTLVDPTAGEVLDTARAAGLITK